ncbi:hypothetical protein M9Y10_026594 [Tritrichomonas musculus]|uniref:Uncharacterized protein n=1 Tax=Tritrichomonas musculus TaxID=1915356 RepID=A0ABR2H610_9EUKA
MTNLLVRGHECVDEGIEKLFNDKCITVFSASSYFPEMSNSSGILRIYKENDKAESVFFPPLKRFEKADTSYFKDQSFAQKKINRSSLPQISSFKKDLFQSIEQNIPLSFDIFHFL